MSSSLVQLDVQGKHNRSGPATEIPSISLDILGRAYDDARGVTAAFNLNLLARIDRELGADFRLEDFRHRAVYNSVAGHIEMYLESLRSQTVHIGGDTIEIAAGELICTEHSHKYTLKGFRIMAETAGFTVARVWTDDQELFSVQLLDVVAGSAADANAST